MPRACNLCSVCLVWHFLVSAFLCCVRSISAEVRTNSFFGGVMLNHQNGISAAIAVCTWHSVSSGFFPPELLTNPRQEQVAYATEDQMAFQPLVAPPLVLVQADLGLLVLETALDAPPREGNKQHRLDRGSRRCVTHEELQLVGVQDIAGDV